MLLKELTVHIQETMTKRLQELGYDHVRTEMVHNPNKDNEKTNLTFEFEGGSFDIEIIDESGKL